ncbi:MAG: hypothetical protein KME43_24375 [Myxacorys chilensis ATA2-1-KO14]|jgi:hypothetical protein|nr:hypothetical protein [Myxacorys chilensis ATA2-1-KO14]
MPKSLPEKCRLCAKLPATEAKQRHGVEGDGCWDSRVCPNRRSYARHRDRRNQQRNQKRWAEQGRITVQLDDDPLAADTLAQIRQHSGMKQIQFETELPDAGYSAVLKVYRRAVDAPLVAISGEVWCGRIKEAEIVPIACATLTPRQVEIYVERLLKKLSEVYGIRKFAALEELAPELYSLPTN